MRTTPPKPGLRACARCEASARTCTAVPALQPSRVPIRSPGQPSPLTVTLTLHPGSPRHARTRLARWLQRCAEGGWLRPQAEAALIEAARGGDDATLKRLVAEGVNVNAADDVSAAPPAAPGPLRPSPSAPSRRPPPPLPRPHRRRSPRVALPPRLRRTATRPSGGRLSTASSTASSTSSPRAPTLRPQRK